MDAQSSGQGDEQIHVRASEGEVLLTGKQERVQTATLTGNVRVERLLSRCKPMLGARSWIFLERTSCARLMLRTECGLHSKERGRLPRIQMPRIRMDRPRKISTSPLLSSISLLLRATTSITL